MIFPRSCLHFHTALDVALRIVIFSVFLDSSGKMSKRLANICAVISKIRNLVNHFSCKKEDIKDGWQVFSVLVLKTIVALIMFSTLFANIRLSLPRYCSIIMGGVSILSILLDLGPCQGS